MTPQTHALQGASAGQHHTLVSWHFGPGGTGRKAYIQASLHADELPGMLVAHHLKALLQEAEDAGQLRGEIVLVPVANPIGLGQRLLHGAQGRFELASGQNFNRGYPDFHALLGDLSDRLGPDAADNARAIRAAMHAALAQWPCATPLDALRRTLVGLALDAELVLDLHCDTESVLHLYGDTPFADEIEALARCLGAQTVLLSEGSGALCFDESLSQPWWRWARSHGARRPVPLACLGVTVELRGEQDVSHALAERDAQGLLRYLAWRGLIDAPQAQPLPPWQGRATPLAGSQTLRAPHPGVIVFKAEPGVSVTAGQPLAELIEPLEGLHSTLRAPVDGVLYARTRQRYATAGMDICKLAGREAVRGGYLLSP